MITKQAQKDIDAMIKQMATAKADVEKVLAMIHTFDASNYSKDLSISEFQKVGINFTNFGKDIVQLLVGQEEGNNDGSK